MCVRKGGGGGHEGDWSNARTFASVVAMLSKSSTSVLLKRSPSDGGMIRSSLHPSIVTEIHSSNTHLRRTRARRCR